MKIPRIMLVMTALMTFASTGVSSNLIHINAKRIHSHRVIHIARRHRKMSRVRHHHEDSAKLTRLEDQLGVIRFKQDCQMPENNWQGHHATKNKHRFQHDYILGLSDYAHYVHSTDVAALTGALDASFYASVQSVRRYAHTHHLSHRWIMSNLEHPVYGYNFSRMGCGTRNFMSGTEMTPLFSRKWQRFIVRTNLRTHHIKRQWLNGVKYGSWAKAKYYQLRTPSVSELTYLKNHYVKNVYSNPLR